MSIHETTDPAFTIRIEPARKLVEIAMIGFWSGDDLARFNTRLREMLPTLVQAGCPMGDQVTVFDLTAYQVQGQDVLAGLAAMADDPSIASRRTAVVLSTGLLKLQARRIAPGYALFDTRAAAIAWVMEYDPA